MADQGQIAGTNKHGPGRAATLGIATLVLLTFAAGVLVGYRMSRPRVSGPAANVGRSPIPQPDETFGQPIPPVVLGSADASPLAPKTDEPVAWRQAGRYMGMTITVEGKVVNTHNTGKVCFLNFTENSRSGFYVILFDRVLDSWEKPPQDFFLDRTIRVKGKVSSYKGRPQIRVERTDQILRID